MPQGEALSGVVQLRIEDVMLLCVAQDALKSIVDQERIRK